MNKDFIIIRNVINKSLFEKTKIDNDLQMVVDGKGGMYGQRLLSKLFVDDKIQDKYKFICLIDEDCLLYDIQHIYNIISYMEENSIDIMGVPDGGTIKHRKHRPDVPNLFFTIIDATKLKKINKEELKSYSIPQGERTTTYAYDSFEPYYKTLCYMNEKLKYNFVPLDAKTILDGTTTEVYFNSQPICLHTWYARKYNEDEFQTKRINKAISYGLTQR